jgi:hypothetical protein
MGESDPEFLFDPYRHGDRPYGLLKVKGRLLGLSSALQPVGG